MHVHYPNDILDMFTKLQNFSISKVSCYLQQTEQMISLTKDIIVQSRLATLRQPLKDFFDKQWFDTYWTQLMLFWNKFVHTSCLHSYIIQKHESYYLFWVNIKKNLLSLLLHRLYIVSLLLVTSADQTPLKTKQIPKSQGVWFGQVTRLPSVWFGQA